ncbi:MAG: SiaB family protein kinase, partial [SAR324 cluster bacterium]|nr:SiaB family protein kinase [SAR324 cluster bacterium]
KRVSMQSQDFHKLLEQRRTFFCYSGLLSEDVLSTFSGIVREQMSEIEDDTEITKRVFGIFVEQAQNVIRYSKDRIAEGGTGTVAISRAEDGFLIEAINPMDHENAEGLQKNLNELKAMDSKELRKAYKQRLREGPPEGSKGAGLGFIEMARKADRFEFDFVGSTELLFVFKVWIKETAS